MRIIGHRGARREAPENTLGGFQHIKNLGIRGVEFDIRQPHGRCRPNCRAINIGSSIII